MLGALEIRQEKEPNNKNAVRRNKTRGVFMGNNYRKDSGFSGFPARPYA
tara:strand:- start:1211 stop:1357 length:147 start_codon:yes stop_codon:yes gene_type:complete